MICVKIIDRKINFNILTCYGKATILNVFITISVKSKAYSKLLNSDLSQFHIHTLYYIFLRPNILSRFAVPIAVKCL